MKFDQSTEVMSKVVEDLNICGYAVVGNFISPSDISKDFIYFLGDAEKFRDGVIKHIQADFMAKIKRKVECFIPDVAENLGLLIDRKNYEYCAIRIERAIGEPVLRTPFNKHSDPKVAPGGVLNWHLDHFSYYLHEDHKNWLICYLPVVKSSSKFANVAIAPDNVVKERDPDTHRRLVGRGAIRLRKVEWDTLDWFKNRFPGEQLQVDDWYAIDDYDNSTMGWKIKFDPEECKVIPELNVGDLLVMRADVLHRTSDAVIDRISVRCDAVPLNAARTKSFFGLLNLSLLYFFMGKKRKYALRGWLLWEWKRRLRLREFIREFNFKK